jgi:hypothetical protein
VQIFIEKKFIAGIVGIGKVDSKARGLVIEVLLASMVSSSEEILVELENGPQTKAIDYVLSRGSRLAYGPTINPRDDQFILSLGESVHKISDIKSISSLVNLSDVFEDMPYLEEDASPKVNTFISKRYSAHSKFISPKSQGPYINRRSSYRYSRHK